MSRRHEYEVVWRTCVAVELPAGVDPDSVEAEDLAALAAADIFRDSGPGGEEVEYVGPAESA